MGRRDRRRRRRCRRHGAPRRPAGRRAAAPGGPMDRVAARGRQPGRRHGGCRRRRSGARPEVGRLLERVRLAGAEPHLVDRVGSAVPAGANATWTAPQASVLEAGVTVLGRAWPRSRRPAPSWTRVLAVPQAAGRTRCVDPLAVVADREVADPAGDARLASMGPRSVVVGPSGSHSSAAPTGGSASGAAAAGRGGVVQRGRSAPPRPLGVGGVRREWRSRRVGARRGRGCARDGGPLVAAHGAASGGGDGSTRIHPSRSAAARSGSSADWVAARIASSRHDSGPSR